MERRTSIGKIRTRLSGHKKDDGHLAADHKAKDLTPLIRTVDAAIKAMQPGQAVKVLYRKQDKNDKFFLATDFDVPGQSQAYEQPSLQTSQRYDATSGEMQRAMYWMNKLPDKPAVQAAGAAVIDLCANNSTTEYGLACTVDLRDRIQALHDAIHDASETPRGRKDPDGGPTDFSLRSLQRTITNHSRSTSRSTSPQKPLSGSTQSPRVSFASADETHFVKVSPRQTTRVTTGKPLTPRLGQEREVPHDVPHLVHNESQTVTTSPPNRPLPDLPTAASQGGPQSTEPSLRHRPLELSPFERNRPHPKPLLPTQSNTSRQSSQPNTPADTPRDPD